MGVFLRSSEETEAIENLLEQPKRGAIERAQRARKIDRLCETEPGGGSGHDSQASVPLEEFPAPAELVGRLLRPRRVGRVRGLRDGECRFGERPCDDAEPGGGTREQRCRRERIAADTEHGVRAEELSQLRDACRRLVARWSRSLDRLHARQPAEVSIEVVAEKRRQDFGSPIP
jgi:hypothetical protein